MWFVGLGVLLILLKVGDVGFVAGWSWFAVLSPFALAVIWWVWADGSGYTQRKAMDRLEERQRKRRQRTLEALGRDKPGQRR